MLKQLESLGTPMVPDFPIWLGLQRLLQKMAGLAFGTYKPGTFFLGELLGDLFKETFSVFQGDFWVNFQGGFLEWLFLGDFSVSFFILGILGGLQIKK